MNSKSEPVNRAQLNPSLKIWFPEIRSQDISLSLLACVFEFCCDFDGSVKHEVKKMNFALENLGKNASNMFYKITKRRASIYITSFFSALCFKIM